MKVIGQRISVLEKEDLLSIVILPGLDKKKLWLIFTWLMAWSICGLVVFINYFKTTDSVLQLFIIVYLSFWAYFEFNILRSFLWKRSGKEKLWIKEGQINYQRELNGKGKIHTYNLDLTSKVSVVELKSTRLADTINQSFWVKGGERLEYFAQGKTIRFGMQLTDQEAIAMQKEINRYIK